MYVHTVRVLEPKVHRNNEKMHALASMNVAAKSDAEYGPSYYGVSSEMVCAFLVSYRKVGRDHSTCASVFQGW